MAGFLDLPGEIRNHIYQYLFDTAPRRVIHQGQPAHDALVPPICKVSRKIREETLPLHFSEPLWTLGPLDFDFVSRFADWVFSIPASCIHLPRRFKFELHDYRWEGFDVEVVVELPRTKDERRNVNWTLTLRVDSEYFPVGTVALRDVEWVLRPEFLDYEGKRLQKAVTANDLLMALTYCGHAIERRIDRLRLVRH
ncbi:hypothetical protein K402DRAFT_422398 [Aulographum hederae CBS 113979]|uniref:F-box domain-containing protein n=1 Tax=Aulographum hederae CBS 113979 TaxID=1176131 RepID=A0A6G1GVX4_9PEZI|nr:hypothetical protein K402DRAFT_422398 [Aulographum hederae CBS 113979]